jgi:hypothetical protein
MASFVVVWLTFSNSRVRRRLVFFLYLSVRRPVYKSCLKSLHAQVEVLNPPVARQEEEVEHDTKATKTMEEAVREAEEETKIM